MSTLKELLLGLEKKLRQLQKAQEKLDRAKADAYAIAHARWAIEQNTKAVEHYNNKIRQYGSGIVIEVTGKAWSSFRNLEVPQPFIMYLNCKDEEEARLLLEIEKSQAGEYSLIWDTLKFRTIRLKQLNFTF